MEGRGAGDDGASTDDGVSGLASLGFLLGGFGASLVIGPVCFRAKRGMEKGGREWNEDRERWEREGGRKWRKGGRDYRHIIVMI